MRSVVGDHQKTCIRSPCAIKLRQRLQSNVVGLHRNCENVAGKKYCLVDEVNEKVNTIFSICSRYLRVGTDFKVLENTSLVFLPTHCTENIFYGSL